MEKIFPRNLDSLEDIFQFVSTFAEVNHLSGLIADHLYLMIEEIFTNLLKYNPQNQQAILINLNQNWKEAEITVIDSGSKPFDIKKATDVDLNQPLRNRKPGGFGLHLVKQLATQLDYQYRDGVTKIVITRKLEE